VLPILENMSVPKITATILRGSFFVARCLGLVFFRLKNSKDNVVAFEESGWNRLWWKWLSVILRLVPLCVAIYTYTMWIEKEDRLKKILKFSQLASTILSYLAMVHLHIFHGPEVIKLVNQYICLFRQIRSLTVSESTGFGTGRELLLIILLFGCLSQEFFEVFNIVPWTQQVGEIVSWACFSYAAFASNMLIRIIFIWYSSLGVLHTEVQKCMSFEIEYQKQRPKHYHRRLESIMGIFSEICNVVSSLQGTTNIYLFLSLIHKLYFITVISDKMIVTLNFWKFYHWFRLIKMITEILLLVLTIQESINQFRYIRELSLDLFFVAEQNDWNKTVEIFVTDLNLNQFRVRPLNLFDISNKFFLVTLSGILNYYVFIVQFVMQKRM
ncbi:hypothetical protein KR084_009113, partial [Drosophila pseudotakahashii]